MLMNKIKYNYFLRYTTGDNTEQKWYTWVRTKPHNIR